MPRPNTNVNTLRRILQQELALGRRMASIAQEETDALVNNNAALVAILEAELRQCTTQHAVLETARANTVRELSWALQMESFPTFGNLLAALPSRESESLEKLKDEILTIQRALEILNSRNRILLDNLLEYVRFSLDAITTAALQPARYGVNLVRIATPAFYVDSRV